ncbi:MAG: DUF2061 domain-containing protein [Pseudomonadota bacterium]
MEEKRRLVLKSITWQISGVISMTLIGLVFTSSVSVSGSIAIISSITGFFFYILHEFVWSKVIWGRRKTS